MLQAPAIDMPLPVYPREAKERRIGGKVQVKILIDATTGSVSQACAVDGDEVLQTAAKDAALRARFCPYWCNAEFKRRGYGHLETLVTYDFVLQ